MRTRLPTLIGLVMAFGVASCAAGPRLNAPATWAVFTQSSLSARCDPYFSRPFEGAETVDVAVIGMPDNVNYATRSEFERSGTYLLEIETVLFGTLEQSAVELSFHAGEDGLGHVYGNDVPVGRTMAYLRRSRPGYLSVVRTFLC